MRVEIDNFIIESDKQYDYFEDVVNYIVDNQQRVFEFFEIDRLPYKPTIRIWSYEPFKKHIVSKYGEILPYMSGDADWPTHTITMLNIEDLKQYTTHTEADVNRLQTTAMHEIVHQCHFSFHTDFRETTWLAEGLAQILGGQQQRMSSLDECDFESLKKDFRHCKGAYKYSFIITEYILNNYPHEEVKRLYSDPDYLRERSNTIFDEAKDWVNEQLNNDIKKH